MSARVPKRWNDDASRLLRHTLRYLASFVCLRDVEFGKPSCTSRRPRCAPCRARAMLGAKERANERMCVVCGCTDHDACRPPCTWAQLDPAICSSCVRR